MKTLPARTALFLALLALPLALGARAKPEKFTATLSGASEVPANASKATGKATVTIDGDKLTFELDVSNMSDATMAHIHGAAPGKNGGVLVPLYKSDSAAGFSGSGVLAQGTVTVKPEVVKAIEAGDAYVNVHTKANPRGELRGQLKPAM